MSPQTPALPHYKAGVFLKSGVSGHLIFQIKSYFKCSERVGYLEESRDKLFYKAQLFSDRKRRPLRTAAEQACL